MNEPTLVRKKAISMDEPTLVPKEKQYQNNAFSALFCVLSALSAQLWAAAGLLESASELLDPPRRNGRKQLLSARAGTTMKYDPVNVVPERIKQCGWNASCPTKNEYLFWIILEVRMESFNQQFASKNSSLDWKLSLRTTVTGHGRWAHERNLANTAQQIKPFHC